jgi:MoaA/NifB/PqqE/SkfB family radical SAM enzyme
MNLQRPQRLNLAIGKRCFVSCRGCYQFFGAQEPNLQAMTDSIAHFVRLGLSEVTISGGDPLTIRGLLSFLRGLRVIGVTDIKVDTVGTGLAGLTPVNTAVPRQKRSLAQLLQAIDYIGIPLDGWSNTSVTAFRTGRPNLFDETVQLLTVLDVHEPTARVIVNTVAHKKNVEELSRILQAVRRHRAVRHWNIFQYAPTDQVDETANQEFAIEAQEFARVQAHVQREARKFFGETLPFSIAFRSIRSRLGEYLLINSDGEAWLPDAKGRTIRLGNLSQGALSLLQAWSDSVRRLRDELAGKRETNPLQSRNLRVTM